MSIMELGALGEFLGSMGVIATLIYLAIQIRQNTRITKAEITKDLYDTSMTKALTVAGNTDLRTAGARAAGQDPDEFVDSIVLFTMARELELQFVMRAGGLLEQSIEASYDSAVPYWLSSRSSRSWLAETKSGFNPNFVVYVDEIIGE